MMLHSMLQGAVALEARARAAEKEAADARKQLKYFKVIMWLLMHRMNVRNIG